MLGLITHRKPGRHETPPSRPPAPPRRPQAAVPRDYRPVLRWLEDRAAGLRSDPEHDAHMAGLHAGLLAWQEQQER